MTKPPSTHTGMLEGLINNLGSLSKERELVLLNILFDKGTLHIGQISSNIRNDNNMYVQQVVDDLLEYGLITQIPINNAVGGPYVHAYKLSISGFGVITLKRVLEVFDRVADEQAEHESSQ